MIVNNVVTDSLVVPKEKDEIFELNPFDYLYIGYMPGEKINGIPGCIKDIIFNDYKIGLWHFYHTEGLCTGCTRYLRRLNFVRN